MGSNMVSRYTHSQLTNRFLTIGVLSIVLFIGIPSCNPITNEMEEYLNAAHDYWGFEGAVLVAYKDRVILKKGYGKANLVMGIPNTPQTKFFIGSITKQFTAAAILKLQEKGLLSVHDTISTYLPDFPSDKADRITIHQLLTHTSGLPNYTDFPEIVLRRTSTIQPDELYSFIKKKPLEFEPGTNFRYSNSGYIVLGEIIKRVSEQSYEAFLHKEILKPAGMHNSGYARREAGLPDRAEGYTTESGGQLVTAPLIHFSVLHTAGALYSTVEDMLKWDIALSSGKILSDSSLKLMFTPYTNYYGYGWYLDILEGHPHAFHTGLLDGFNTIIDKWTNDELTVIVFSNDDDAPVDKIARGLARIAFQANYDFPARKKAREYDYLVLPEYEGVYQQGPDIYRIIAVFEDELYIHNYGESYQKLLQQSPDTFFFEHDNTQLITFERNADNRITKLKHYNEGYVQSAIRLSDDQAAGFIIHRQQIEIAPEALVKYCGTYNLDQSESDNPEVYALEIEVGPFNSLIAVFGGQRVEVFPHSKTEFFHYTADFLIRFGYDEHNNVTGCSVFLGGRIVHLIKTQL